MRTVLFFSVLLIVAVLAVRMLPGHASAAAPSAASGAPSYTPDGSLVYPENYREWIFLTSGIDMSYGPGSGSGMSTFDNVFVNPDAYKSFVQTGTWPDKTVLVLEIRSAQTKGSINKNGHFQTAGVMGREAHVKDQSRFPGGWAFFGFDDTKPGKLVPLQADCYSCHEKHGAVDTTFVQFYPTLLELAKKKRTLSPAFGKESK
jgi:Cytochrome P460